MCVGLVKDSILPWKIKRPLFFQLGVKFIFLFLLSSGNGYGQITDDPTQHIFLSTRDGLEWVNDLRSTNHENSTTTYRKEQKGVVAKETLDTIFHELSLGDSKGNVPGINFKLRDLSNEAGRLNGTFSIYGQTASFENQGNLKTNIKFRVRMYVTFSPDFKTIRRADSTKETVFLELKVKNPHYTEPQGVNKFRLILPDEAVLNLFRANPNSPHFDELLESIKKTALEMKGVESQKENTVEKMDAMFRVIKKIATLKSKESGAPIGDGFIRPRFITTYARTSYKFIERNYPIATPVRVSKWKFWKDQKDYEFVPSKKKMEFQLTVDNHVQAFTPDPELFSEDTKTIDVEKYFSPSYEGTQVSYPENSTTVEIKEPGIVAKRRHNLRSPIHQFLDDHLTDNLKKNVLEGFLFNHGKAGNLSRKLRLELVKKGLLETLEVIK